MRLQKVEVDEPPALAPSVNISCRITEGSPLAGKTYWDLERDGAGIIVSVTATDNQHFQEVFARKYYAVEVRCLHLCMLVTVVCGGVLPWQARPLQPARAHGSVCAHIQAALEPMLVIT